MVLEPSANVALEPQAVAFPPRAVALPQATSFCLSPPVLSTLPSFHERLDSLLYPASKHVLPFAITTNVPSFFLHITSACASPATNGDTKAATAAAIENFFRQPAPRVGAVSFTTPLDLRCDLAVSSTATHVPVVSL